MFLVSLIIGLNFYKGEFISNTILNAKSFEKLMTKIKEE